jgi:leucyl aminopeptidase (aminopeptidase T)/DNA-binding transcriptional ArsR family regulator
METEDLGHSAPRREISVLDREAQFKALSNPERVRILALLIERPGTAKQVADWVGQTRGRVHYHIKELEKTGLVEIVARIERGGVVEKYYRAVARNFYVGRGIGEYAGLTGDVREMLSASMLGWRRREVLEVDQDEIANKVITECLGTRPRDVVIVKGDMSQRDMMMPLNKAIGRAGAHCCITCGRGPMGDFLLRWKSEISSIIVIEEPLEYPIENGLRESEDEEAGPPEFLDRLVESGRKFRYAGIPGYPLEDPVIKDLLASGKRVIYVGYPTPQKAQVMGIDFRDLHDACWTALDVNYRGLAERCESMKEVLEAARDVSITSLGGTNLTFSIGGREVFVDDGIISDWEVEHGRGWGHLPAGKVIVAPVAGTANGVLHSDMTDYFGVRIAGIQIEFRKGEIVAARARENDDLLQLVLSKGTGDVRKLGGFELGMNPQIRDPIGYAVWDSKAFGDATLWIGDNLLIGGENESNLSWGFSIVRPTVSLDGTIVLKNRDFRHQLDVITQALED